MTIELTCTIKSDNEADFRENVPVPNLAKTTDLSGLLEISHIAGAYTL